MAEINDTMIATPSVPNYRSFDFFDIKFDHSSYSKKIYGESIMACRYGINRPHVAAYMCGFMLFGTYLLLVIRPSDKDFIPLTTKNTPCIDLCMVLLIKRQIVCINWPLNC